MIDRPMHIRSTLASGAAFAAATFALCTLAAAQEQTLKVASFNILHGGKGDGGPLSQTAAVITASGADVVAVQESDGSGADLAALLGWHYRVFSFDRGTELGNTDNAILSRYPITQTLRGGVRVEIAARTEAYVFSAHLPAYPYQPYDIRDGSVSNEAQAITGANAARGARIDQLLAEMSPYLSSGAAVFLAGDMNEPSHLDWTAAAASAGKHAFKVAWPASTKTTSAGLVDSYRQVHPNEVTHVGNTWTNRPGANEVHDRIDFVYAGGRALATTNSQIVGENSSNADIVVSPYPSDHRAVVSTFSIPDSTLAPLRTGVNLISNPGAEGDPGAAASADRTLTDWETAATSTLATAQLYNKSGYAAAWPAGGVNYFYGGDIGASSAETHSISQTISVAELAAAIDAGDASFELSGYFGGYLDQADTASLTSAFLNDSGGPLSSAEIGNVTAADRGNMTGLLYRSTTGALPVATREVQFTLTFAKGAGGTFNDGSADNLSFVVSVPEPGSGLALCALSCACALRRVKRRRPRQPPT